MSEGWQSLLARLANGDWHNGEQLASAAGISRAGVWKQVSKLRELGLDVETSRQKGYRLPNALPLLEPDRIKNELEGIAAGKKLALEYALSVDSTQVIALEQRSRLDDSIVLCVAEHQSGGRGRLGRQWCSPLAGNLYFTVAARMPARWAQMSLYPLALATSLAKVLNAFSSQEIKVKWPNDLVMCDKAGMKKIAGILIDVRTENAADMDVFTGVGVNLAASPAMEGIEQAWTVLDPAGMPDRNMLLVGLFAAIVELLEICNKEDAVISLDEFRKLDALEGRNIKVGNSQGEYRGQYMGVDESGRLRLLHDGKTLCFSSADVSLGAYL